MTWLRIDLIELKWTEYTLSLFLLCSLFSIDFSTSLLPSHSLFITAKGKPFSFEKEKSRRQMKGWNLLECIGGWAYCSVLEQRTAEDRPFHWSTERWARERKERAYRSFNSLIPRLVLVSVYRVLISFSFYLIYLTFK